MKLAFQVIANKDRLRVKFLRAKYKCEDGVPMDMVRSNCSWAWKGITIVWLNVRDNIQWRDAGAIGPSRISVADMVNGNGEWSLQEVWYQCVARRGNAVVDGMAKLSDGRSLVIGRFPEPPAAIGSLLLLDSPTLSIELIILCYDLIIGLGY
ncbi:hypothetical protein V6N11_072729 [Hibiscus sabdariffa]|uniref:Uncharacterized protein n=1 Tax=Hibiscus sabdariffa TaxID=183260 RepID=A0ABR2NDZ6_9ROSI